MILLQAASSGLTSLIPMVLMLVVVYFFMIRPQSQKQKAQQSFSESLEKGKDVVTASGIIGKINKIEGTVVTLQIAANTFIRVTRSSISKDMTEAYATTLQESNA